MLPCSVAHVYARLQPSASSARQACPHPFIKHREPPSSTGLFLPNTYPPRLPTRPPTRSPSKYAQRIPHKHASTREHHRSAAEDVLLLGPLLRRGEVVRVRPACQPVVVRVTRWAVGVGGPRARRSLLSVGSLLDLGLRLVENWCGDGHNECDELETGE